MKTLDVNEWFSGNITFRDNEVPEIRTDLIVSADRISAPLMVEEWKYVAPITATTADIPTSVYDKLMLNAGRLYAGNLCGTSNSKITVNEEKGECEKMYTGRTYGERARSDRDIDRAIKSVKEREKLEEKRCREAHEERQKMEQDEVTAELKAIFDKAFKKVAVDYDNWAIIVYWEDGMKTVVRCTEDDRFDEEKGVLLALLKRAYGSSTQAKKFFDRTLKR